MQQKQLIIDEAQKALNALARISLLVDEYSTEHSQDNIGSSEWLCDKYPFNADLNEFTHSMSLWVESMTENIHTTYIVEECTFPLNEDAEWDVCCEFTNSTDADDFAWRHYESVTNFTDSPNLCTCEDCAEGWKVSPDSWQSYSVRVTTKTTTKKAH